MPQESWELVKPRVSHKFQRCTFMYSGMHISKQTFKKQNLKKQATIAKVAYCGKTYYVPGAAWEMGVVCWVDGPRSPNTIRPEPWLSLLVQKEKESATSKVLELASVLGTEIGNIPKPSNPSGAAPCKNAPVWTLAHLHQIIYHPM